MRIVLIGPVYPYRGGIAHYTTMLYRAMRDQKHEVLLVSFKRQYPQRLFPGRSDKDPSQKPLEVEEARFWIDSLNPITWLATSRRIHQYRPDVVILQWWTSFFAPVWFALGLMLRLFLHKPLLIICHNVLPHETRWWDVVLAKAALRWGTGFTVQSAEEERRLRSLRAQAQATIAPLPLFDMFVDENISRNEARKRLGVPDDVPMLLFFGIVRQYKGLQDLLVVLPQVQAHVGRVILLVAGEFWEEKQSYLETIRALGLEDSVVLDDRYIPNEEVGIYFSAADVLVAPYRHVTGSAVAQMAQAFGLPVVTAQTNQASVTDGVEPGIETPSSGGNALATAIVRQLQRAPQETSTGGAADDQKQEVWGTLLNVIENAVDANVAQRRPEDC